MNLYNLRKRAAAFNIAIDAEPVDYPEWRYWLLNSNDFTDISESYCYSLEEVADKLMRFEIDKIK
jgi:hypothetical protein